MTRTQLLILVGIVILIAALSLPPYLEYDRKVKTADTDVDIIAGAIKRFHKHTNEYPRKLEDLVTDPGVEGWNGSYLEEIPKTPWGGSYQLLPAIYKVCISLKHPRVPEKYKHGGVAEISRVYHANQKEGAKYWWK
ncbi:MAG: type II secretion system protein GspG [Candidatus Poribacteria bacterium]|nr:type II secretion system protein GspG [Candidatus Poribacteria bacterium]